MMSYNTNILQPVILFECSEVCSLEIEAALFQATCCLPLVWSANLLQTSDNTQCNHCLNRQHCNHKTANRGIQVFILSNLVSLLLCLPTNNG